ncbi:zinc-binding protein A33 isoform X11 [Gadus morhua]|uniref:zinc-binding protein A33 isoform X11 n=1 Tax=Gadus morhua TaxID=8049 RepID=UPI0011B55CCC|nr:zinc-binding protein A33-like isoform X11 [Gadus morhua]
MATSSSRPEEDCICPVCCDFYSDPIILLCGHSFCKNCIQEWWTQKGSKTCPVCKEMFSLDRPPRNLALKNLTESLKEEASRRTAEDLCDTHGERLKLFCINHQKPICLICRDAKDHKKHQCVPINEAAADRKKELRIALMHLRTKLSKFEEEKLTCNKMCTHIQNYDAIKKRAQCTLPDPETPSGALIDEAKHRGNLLFHVWKKMKSIIQYTPFCLDPNTAKSHVIVSDDLMSLTKNYPGKEVPSNPERCTLHDQVLGSTGISSGRHSWDVQLGGIWSVGVITKTRRLEEVTEAGLVLHSGIVVQRSPEKMDFPIEVDKIPEKVRLSFDQDNGKLLFYDLDTKKVIRTITYKFKGVYFPFFSGDVKLIPQCPPLV